MVQKEPKLGPYQACLDISDDEFVRIRTKDKSFCDKCKCDPYAYSSIEFNPVHDDSRAIWGELKGKESRLLLTMLIMKL